MERLREKDLWRHEDGLQVFSLHFFWGGGRWIDCEMWSRDFTAHAVIMFYGRSVCELCLRMGCGREGDRFTPRLCAARLVSVCMSAPQPTHLKAECEGMRESAAFKWWSRKANRSAG